MPTENPSPGTKLAVVQAAMLGVDPLVQLPIFEKPLDIAAVLARHIPRLAEHLVCQYYLDEDTAKKWLTAFLAQRAWEPSLSFQACCRAGAFRRLLGYGLHRFVLAQMRSGGGEGSGLAEWLRAANELSGANLTEAWDQAARAFDVAWARAILADSLKRMESFCLASQQQIVWQMFESRTLGPMISEAAPPAYPELAERFGLLSPSQASRLLRLGRRFLGLFLRVVVAEYVPDSCEVGEEIRELKTVLQQAG
jgi:hypothetical protein